MVHSCHNQRRKVSKYPLPTFINEGEASSTRGRALVLDDSDVSPVGPGCHQTLRRIGLGMDMRILDVGLEVAEAYGITNGSSQGTEPQDDPLVLDRCFPARYTTLKGRKMTSTYPPHLSSDGKRHEKRFP
jgi:hypothetical protein